MRPSYGQITLRRDAIDGGSGDIELGGDFGDGTGCSGSTSMVGKVATGVFPFHEAQRAQPQATFGGLACSWWAVLSRSGALMMKSRPSRPTSAIAVLSPNAAVSPLMSRLSSAMPA